MKTVITKIFLILSVIVLTLTSYGCGDKLEPISDEEVKAAILDYDFMYEVNITGVNPPTYKVLWDGYDDVQSFGPSYSKESRIYTYLTEYLPTDSGYYAIYLKKDLINDYLDWLKEFEKNQQIGKDYHFSKHDAKEIIDGKYLYCYARFGEGDDAIKIEKAENLSDIRFMSGDYQLVFCCQTKKAIIKENLSEGKKLNKQINLYNRVELVFDDLNKAPVEYTFPEEEERDNQEDSDKWFSYEGEYIAAYSKQYEEKDYAFYPEMNVAIREAKVVKEGGKKYVILPRYYYDSNGERVDLFEEIEDRWIEDVFREYKEEFRGAYVKDLNTEGERVVYALYKYNNVVDVIRDDE